jgi:hypothetical protein
MEIEVRDLKTVIATARKLGASRVASIEAPSKRAVFAMTPTPADRRWHHAATAALVAPQSARGDALGVTMEVKALADALKTVSWDGPSSMLTLEAGEADRVRLSNEWSGHRIARDARDVGQVGAPFSLGECEAEGDADEALADDLARVLVHARTATSKDETRYHLTGVLFGADGQVVATDGHRMHVSDSPFRGNQLAGTVIPRAALDLVVDQIKTPAKRKAIDNRARAWRNGSRRFIELGSVIVAWQPLAEEPDYPNWKQVNGSDHISACVGISADQLASIADRCASAAGKDAAPIVLHFPDGGGIEVSLGDSWGDNAGETVGHVDAGPRKSDELRSGIAVDARYLVDALIPFYRQAITLRTSGRDATFSPLRFESNSTGAYSVVMPMRRS